MWKGSERESRGEGEVLENDISCKRYGGLSEKQEKEKEERRERLRKIENIWKEEGDKGDDSFVENVDKDF